MRKRHYTIRSTMTAEQIHSVMYKNTDLESLWDILFINYICKKPLIGELHKDGFRIIYNRKYGKNKWIIRLFYGRQYSYIAFASGTYETIEGGTNIHVHMERPLFFRIFMSIWFAIWLFMIGTILWEGYTGDSSDGMVLGVSLCIGMLVFVCTMLRREYRKEIRRIETKLRELLEYY